MGQGPWGFSWGGISGVPVLKLDDGPRCVEGVKFVLGVLPIGGEVGRYWNWTRDLGGW